MKEFIITKNDAGQRLDRFLGKAIPLLPSSLLQKYLRKKKVRINGKVAPRDIMLNVGDVLSVYINDEFFDSPSASNAYLKITKPSLDIIYEDKNIIIADKKAGLLCHESAAGESDNLISHIKAKLYLGGEWVPGKEASFVPALCNRIDKNTSGLVIAAKNASALRIINEKIRNFELEKIYICVVCGFVTPDFATLRNFLKKDDVSGKMLICNEESGGKLAITHYRVLCSSQSLSLLECRIETGRTHQIRAQLAHAGFPILGDPKYGNIKANKKYDEKQQLLHSYGLCFAFKDDAVELNYLKNARFKSSQIGFVSKYFPNCSFD